MKIDILKEYAALEAMETKELLQVWNKHFDVPPQSRNNRTYRRALASIAAKLR